MVRASGENAGTRQAKQLASRRGRGRGRSGNNNKSRRGGGGMGGTNRSGNDISRNSDAATKKNGKEHRFGLKQGESELMELNDSYRIDLSHQ